jgi:GSH-dependent disulfide-bond oxidoreductase
VYSDPSCLGRYHTDYSVDGAAEFLSVQDYKNVHRWADALVERAAVRRGRMVNRVYGEPSSQLHERHDASDFDTKTQDKLAAGR